MSPDCDCEVDPNETKKCPTCQIKQENDSLKRMYPDSKNIIGKEKIFDYAYDWFKHHADQRQNALYYYIVFIGLFVVGLGTCLANKVYSIVPFFTGLIVFLSFVFLIIDIRNEQLVEMGKSALSELEKDSGFEGLTSCIIQRKNNSDETDKGRRIKLISHRLWYKLIYIVIMLDFLIFTCLFYVWYFHSYATG